MDKQEEPNIEQLQKNLDDVTNNWKRALADFENYKRRKESESKELLEFAKEVAVAKLLPTLDALGQALKHMPVYTPSAASAATPPWQGESAPQQIADAPQFSPPNKGEEVVAEGAFMGNQEAGKPALSADMSAHYIVDNGFAKSYINWQNGISGIIMQLDKVLEEMGVKKIEAVGKQFDPHFHEAVREAESEEDDGIIVEELQSGFELNGKVIRPSQVVISKKNN